MRIIGTEFRNLCSSASWRLLMVTFFLSRKFVIRNSPLKLSLYTVDRVKFLFKYISVHAEVLLMNQSDLEHFDRVFMLDTRYRLHFPWHGSRRKLKENPVSRIFGAKGYPKLVKIQRENDVWSLATVTTDNCSVTHCSHWWTSYVIVKSIRGFATSVKRAHMYPYDRCRAPTAP